jgi:IS1 family transposase
MWSFVGFKGNKQWIWLAIDVLTKEIVGVYIGKRDETGARGLWDSLPKISRQCAVSYTDFWSAYGIVFLKKDTKRYPRIVAKRTI